MKSSLAQQLPGVLILLEKTFELPHDGTYFIWAFRPLAHVGILWLAAGQPEECGLEDFLRAEQIVNDMGQVVKAHSVDRPAVSDVCDKTSVND